MSDRTIERYVPIYTSEPTKYTLSPDYSSDWKVDTGRNMTTLWKPVYAASDDSDDDTTDTTPADNGDDTDGGSDSGGTSNSLNIPTDKYSKSSTALPSWGETIAKSFSSTINPWLKSMLESTMSGYDNMTGLEKVDVKPFDWFNVDYGGNTTEETNGQGFLARALQSLESVPSVLQRGFAVQRGQLMDDLVSAIRRSSAGTSSNLAAQGLAAMAPAAAPAVYNKALTSGAQALSELEQAASQTLAAYTPQYATIAENIANAMATDQQAATQQQIDQNVSAAELELKSLVAQGDITAQMGAVLASVLSAARVQSASNALEPYQLMVQLLQNQTA